MIKHLRITVEGRAYDVSVEVLGEDTAPRSAPAVSAGSTAAPLSAPAAPAPAPRAAAHGPAGSGDLPSPLAGKIVSIDCAVGQAVSVGQKVLTLEAMKMNTVVAAPHAGTVKAVHVAVGDAVEEGQPLVTIA